MNITDHIKALDMVALLRLDDVQVGERVAPSIPLPGGKLMLEAAVSRRTYGDQCYFVTLVLVLRRVSGLRIVAESDHSGWTSLPHAIVEAQGRLVINLRQRLEWAAALVEVAGEDFGVEDEEEGTL